MLATVVSFILAASESQRHYHKGKLSRYEIGPPDIKLSASDESRLRSGRAVLQTVTKEDGSPCRLVSVQDIQAPTPIVCGRIMDINNYANMVQGVNFCEKYDEKTEKGKQIVKATYEISALHMKFKYYVTHVFDPKLNCMVFALDTDRRSDLDDTVGYWFVDPKGRNKCRVFYSCECKLRGWVPGPVYNLLTKEAVKKATTWVEREAVKEFRASRAPKLPKLSLPALPDPQELLTSVSELREQVASQLEGLKLPQMPSLPSLPRMPLKPQMPQREAAAVRWGERRQTQWLTVRARSSPSS